MIPIQQQKSLKMLLQWLRSRPHVCRGPLQVKSMVQLHGFPLMAGDCFHMSYWPKIASRTARTATVDLQIPFDDKNSAYHLDKKIMFRSKR
jgi:hypothetical protein